MWVPRKKCASFSMSSIFWTQPYKVNVGHFGKMVFNQKWFFKSRLVISNKPGQVRSWNRSEGQLRNKLHRLVQSQSLEISACQLQCSGPIFALAVKQVISHDQTIFYVIYSNSLQTHSPFFAGSLPSRMRVGHTSSQFWTRLLCGCGWKLLSN